VPVKGLSESHEADETGHVVRMFSWRIVTVDKEGRRLGVFWRPCRPVTGRHLVQLGVSELAGGRISEGQSVGG